MPLLDHFGEDLPQRWEGFHSAWTTFIAADLNGEILPEDYLALPEVAWGTVEVDVATTKSVHDEFTAAEGGIATATYAPPVPAIGTEIDFVDLDSLEIRVRRFHGDRELVAAIELVSPGNKDRPAHRDAFVAKCMGYLQRGISLGIVDVVPERAFNLHRSLCEFMGIGANAIGTAWPRYAISYRVARDAGRWRLEGWPQELVVNRELPTLPLWLEEDLVVPLNLESTYSTTCRSLRIPV